MATKTFNKPILSDVLVPDLFYKTALANPDYPLAYIVDGDNDGTQNDFESVSWSEFMDAALKAATALQIYLPTRRLGDQAIKVALLARNSYGNLVNIMAMMINRWQPLLISPKNSAAGVAHLLTSVGASHFFVEADFMSVARSAQSSVSAVTVVEIEPFAVGNCSLSQADFLASPEETAGELDEPALFMHTSGSTDFPKVIPYRHRFILTSAEYRRRDRAGEGSIVYTPSPVWHALGMGLSIVAMPAVGDIHVYVNSSSPPTGEALLRYIRPFKSPHVQTPPSFLEEIYRMGPAAVSELAAAKDMIGAGAPLNQDVGDHLVSKGVNLGMMYGSSELSWASRTIGSPVPEDWAYIALEDAHNYEFRPMGDGTFELLAKPTLVRFPAVTNETEPDLFATRDLFTPHPTNKGLWKHAGRKDDITILSNGLKTNNRQIEGLLRQNPLISQAVVFGSGRLLNGVLIQPVASAAQSDTFLVDIWPTVQHINEVVPKHSRLLKELVLQGDPSRPFPETDKGTVRTKHVIREYEDDIEKAYQSLGDWSEVPIPRNLNEQTIRDYVRASVKEVLGHIGTDDQLVFDYGVDSLHAIRIRSGLQALVTSADRGDVVKLPANVVYQFPTIDRMTSFLLEALGLAAVDLIRNEDDSSAETIEQCIEAFSQGLPTSLPSQTQVNQSEGAVYVLSGTTGSLMSQFLALLLQDRHAKQIYCLSRRSSTPGLDRHIQTFENRGLDSTLLLSNAARLEFLDVELSQEHLGLSQAKLSELRNSVTCVIHAAWQLNFNLTLEGFEKVHLAGVRHLLDLCLSATKAPEFYFLSSIAVCGQLKGPVLEDVLHNVHAPLNQGYARAKYVAEQVVARASSAGLPAAIIRLGQASGSTTNGAWSITEHMPILFQSSALLGVFPKDLPDVRWIPVDVAARVLLDIVLSPTAGLSVYHIDNPAATPWHIIAEAAQQVTPDLRFVSNQDWLAAVSQGECHRVGVPATRLLAFFESFLRGEGLPVLDVTKTRKVSKAVDYGPLSTELATMYVKYALAR